MLIQAVKCPKCNDPDCGGLTARGVCYDCDMAALKARNQKAKAPAPKPAEVEEENRYWDK